MSNSDSILGTSSGDSGSMSESSGSTSSEKGFHMDVVPDVREDLAKEVAESSLPVKVGYDWVASDVQN